MSGAIQLELDLKPNFNTVSDEVIAREARRGLIRAGVRSVLIAERDVFSIDRRVDQIARADHIVDVEEVVTDVGANAASDLSANLHAHFGSNCKPISFPSAAVGILLQDRLAIGRDADLFATGQGK